MLKAKHPLLLLALLTLPISSANAHHSFAVHFVPDEFVTISGVVTKFTFNNPHGVLFFDAVNEAGEEVAWKAETNSPNLLRRRGWTKNSFTVGNEVTVEGYPARDGSPRMRINRVTLPDGKELSPGGVSD